MNSIIAKNMLKLASYRRELYNNPKLKYLFFELTDKCNLNCIHCGSNCNSLNNNTLELAVIKKTLDEVSKKYNTKNIMICLTGGEPLLYNNIFEVMTYSKKLGFLIGITSNGTLIDSIVANRLVKCGLDSIAISIDGLEETHDNIRRYKGAFKQAFDGIICLQQAGIEPNVTTVINSRNFNELDLLYNFLNKEKIQSWRILNVDPIGRAKVVNNFLLDKNQLFKLFEYIKKKRFDVKNNIEVTYGCSHFVTYDYEMNIRDFYFQCIAGTQVASIASNGDIVACLDIERRNDLVQGNIYKDNFVDIWENQFKIFRQDWSDKSIICKNCEFKKVCMGDSAHTWDYINNEPLYCINKLIGGK